MDSIELQEQTFGHYGDKCVVMLSTGEVYTGIYRGYEDSTKENPLMLRLEISRSEAARIGDTQLSEIDIRYEVITCVRF